MSIQVTNKTPPEELYRKVVCQSCGWEHKYLPGDIQEAIHTDYGGGSEAWWFIPCQNELCVDKNRIDGRTKIEVKRP
jgi:hypothetical protein